MNIYAQSETKNLNLFVRVYNLQGEKLSKGKVLAVTGNTLQLKGKKGPMNIDVVNIGLIKTKRSEGNNVLIGSIIGASAMGIYGASTADPDAWILPYTAAEGAAMGAIVGLPLGAAVGGITILFKNSKSYIIDGDLVKWNIFQEMISARNY
tara:strand:- start:2001 stop:2453 length:453 start_codon:yes stop_codon:yes gene_type:complete